MKRGSGVQIGMPGNALRVDVHSSQLAARREKGRWKIEVPGLRELTGAVQCDAIDSNDIAISITEAEADADADAID